MIYLSKCKFKKQILLALNYITLPLQNPEIFLFRDIESGLPLDNYKIKTINLKIIS